MAQRTVCLCEGKYIGIESIYTVIQGRQINIPEKVKKLREKSRKNELFCPCGCGSNLILVAGDKNEREQHFRIKDGSFNARCTAIAEGSTSIYSKIVLKCWLDDKLRAPDLESRVPIYTLVKAVPGTDEQKGSSPADARFTNEGLEDADRKYEFTFLSAEKKLAVSYCRDRANLSDEKIEILENNSRGIHVIYVVDFANGGCGGQYPEGLMKVQNRQGYCLLLCEGKAPEYTVITDADYSRAALKAVFYAQDIDGFWKEIVFAEGMLSEFRINEDGSVDFRNQPLISLMEKRENSFLKENERRQARRDEEARKQEEAARRLREFEERRAEAARKRLEAYEAEQERRKEEANRRRAELEEKRKEEIRKEQLEARLREEEFKRNMETNLSQQVRPVRDAEGNRWIRCEFCGKIAKESAFLSYGGIGHVNLGTCKDCAGKKVKI
ncbi:MAG: DNA topoisomerase I [Lachnospiraceae bacterium]|nr:DNA topoisomerase I [Lachnospiraceae bacterium]